jgi:hypothetical protein
MVTESKEHRINTEEKIEHDGVKRMPHERDESPDSQDKEPRGVMKQAAADLEQGLVDTDLHGMRGVEQAVPKSGQPGQATPQAGAAEGMRGQTSTTPSKDGKQ